MYEAKSKRNAWAGILGLSEAATSENFDRDAIDPSSVLFRALRAGNLTTYGEDTDGVDGHVRVEGQAS